MIQTTFRDLRVLIGEDEQLLAIDLAQQLETLGAQVLGIVASLHELEQLAEAAPGGVNAAVLDVALVDGEVYDIVPQLERQGVAVVICTGYHQQERPEGLAHVPWISKPARGEDIANALCLAVDARSVDQIE